MSKSTIGPFVRLPLRLLELQSTGDLKIHDLVVYAWAHTLIREKTGYWKTAEHFIPIAEIARRSKMTRRTISESLRRLSLFNFIKYSHGPGLPVLMSNAVNLSSTDSTPELLEPMSPLSHETCSKEHGDTRARARHEELAALRLLAAEIIRLHPGRKNEHLVELIFDELNNRRFEFTVADLQIIVADLTSQPE